jgi:large subunit ribosomal protein L15
MTTFLSKLPKITQKRKKRLGRGAGSGRGAKSGRGTTRHQTAREDVPIHFEGGQGRMVKRYPLLRGKGKNNSRRARPILLKLDRLNVFAAGDTVNFESLIAKKLVERQAKHGGVKIVVGRNPLSKKLTIKVPISAGAKAAVEKLGGTT